jgi:hypothetical protein
MAGVEGLHTARCVNHPTLSPFNAPMSLLDGLEIIMAHITEGALVGVGKEAVQIALVISRQNIDSILAA